MGNSSSNLRSKRSLDSLILSEPDKKGDTANTSAMEPQSTTSSHSIGSGLTLFHSGWHRRSRSANPAATDTTAASMSMPPPPPYSPARDIATSIQQPRQGQGAQRGRATSRNADEDALEMLRKYNIVFVVDDSSSMSISSVHGSRWKEAGDALASIAEVAAKYDMDGIDIHFLNNKVTRDHMGLKTADSVRGLFSRLSLQPSTPIGEKLEELLLSYLSDLEAAQATGDRHALNAVKPVNYIVITDGEPSDDPESVIVAAAKRLDDGKFPLSQVGIQFVQVGNSRRASSYLQDLDSHLHTRHGMRDIVDTTPFTGKTLEAQSLVKILLGGINRRVDRESELRTT